MKNTSATPRSGRRRAVWTEALLCTCGQELDLCHQAHFVRCGRTLRR